MSYLVKFNDAQGKTWQETFETEQQVLECKDKDSIISIQKLEKELTLEQLQEQVNNKIPQEVKEADFKDKHIKVGDIVYIKVSGHTFQGKVLNKPIWNSDADEPDWEVETTNGWIDMYSLYVR